MIAINAIAVMAAVALVSFLGRGGTQKETSRYKENIADIPALAAALRCGGILADHIVYMGFADGTFRK